MLSSMYCFSPLPLTCWNLTPAAAATSTSRIGEEFGPGASALGLSRMKLDNSSRPVQRMTSMYKHFYLAVVGEASEIGAQASAGRHGHAVSWCSRLWAFAVFVLHL